MMSAVQSPNLMRQAYENYLKAGMVLVPIHSGKGPNHRGWQLKENCWTRPDQINETVGVGLAHAYCSPPTMSLDIDDLVQAREAFAARDINLDALFCAADAVGITSGNPNHAKLIYRMVAPLASKRLMHEGKVIAEFRCATAGGSTQQDVLPSAAIHPVTLQHYAWCGAGHWSAIPAVPTAVLDWWNEMLACDKEFRAPVAGEHDVNLDELRDALFTINASCDHNMWVEIGMGLRVVGEEFVGMWDEWSQTSDKYPGPANIAAKWRSFRTDHPNGVGIATVFHHARAAGWKRPAPDVAGMFSNLAPVAPEDILAGLIQSPPELDLELLPPVLRQRAREVADSIGCDPIVPAWAGLGAASAAADARMRLELVPGFVVPPVTWLMVIGSPADKKTPGMKPMLSVLAEIEKADVPRYRADLLKWEGLEALHAAQKKAFLQEAGSLLNNGEINGPAVKELAPAPIPLRLTVSDITSQKLTRHVADRPYGALCVLDEMASWMTKLTNPMSGDDRSTWVQGYEANQYHLDRVGTGSLTAENFAVSILGAVQPKVFRKATPGLAIDGTLQRFVPAILRGGTSHVGNPIPEWMTSAATYDQAIRTIHGGSLERYSLSPEARRAFRSFQEWADATRKRERFLHAPDAFLTALGKVEGTCGRLAFLFHLLEAPGASTIAGETMARTIGLMQSYVVPALRYAYGEVAGMIEESLEYWVIQFIAQVAHEPKITLSEIRRSARRQIEGMATMEAEEIIRATMAGLELKNWVILTSDKGRHVEWAINPAIAETFKAYRRQVIEAKQARADEIEQKILRHHGIVSKQPAPRGTGTL